MASESQPSTFLIKYHRVGVFVRYPLSYDYEILSEVPNVDLVSLGLVGFINLLETKCTGSMKSLFYLVPGLEFHLGLKPLKCDTDFDNFVQCGVNNDHVLHVYASHSEFELNETTTEQNLGVHDDSGSDLDDDDYNVYGYCSSKESVTASIDHLFNGEEEVLEVRTKRVGPAPKKKATKMFDENFLTSIFSDHWPIHDPNIKWKLMRPHLGERFDGPEQLKRALAFYALANGYKLYYEVNNPMRLVAKCLKDNQEKKCPFRTYEYGTLITSNWIVRNHTKKIMINPTIKVRDIVALILKKYKCKVSVSLARRGKIKALKQYETCLKDHYGIFYVCFKALKEGWIEGCRRVIGLDGFFLKTICKGELLSAVGRDGNNQIYLIVWAIVNVENKENWSWFMQCLINDLGIVDGEGLTIISDQHKSIDNVQGTYMLTSVRSSLVCNISKEAHKHLMERNPKSWSRAYLRTYRACDAVENRISEMLRRMIDMDHLRSIFRPPFIVLFVTFGPEMNIVGIKRLLSAVEVNAASYDCYYCWFKLQLLVGVITAAQD
ncbi:hypothetical protein Tco_1040482 [Tanacetum coccineum]